MTLTCAAKFYSTVVVLRSAMGTCFVEHADEFKIRSSVVSDEPHGEVMWQ